MVLGFEITTDTLTVPPERRREMALDERTFLSQLYRASGIPLSLYDEATDTSETFPAMLSDTGIFRALPESLLHFTRNPDYVISDSFAYYGAVASDKSGRYILAGPIYSTPVTKETVRAFMREWAVPHDRFEEIDDFLRSIPMLSFHRVLSFLSFLHYGINGTAVDPAKHFGLAAERGNNSMEESVQASLCELKELHGYHNTHLFEREMLECIRQGNETGLNALLQGAAGLRAGIVADNSIRQEKNIFIVTTALATRSAIAGGLDPEEAYSLSDLYLQECERTESTSALSSLSYSMLLDFTRRTRDKKIPEGLSWEVYEAIRYITRHTNEAIQVPDVASHVHRSRSFLAVRFREELGTDISSFIMRCKLEEAKSLLTFSDRSLSEISNYLCFSSQAYFQNVFKKRFGMTPKQYRTDSRKIEGVR